tara:strand:+ start:14853 stop:17120 length:2268 start_codon:yes stop_codon:yes gene_type:complete
MKPQKGEGIVVTTPPLTDIRVLELSTGIAGQTAGMLLADLGAQVVRPVSTQLPDEKALPGFLCWNRGKTLVDSLEDPSERAVELCRLAQRADILLADTHPGQLELQGLDAATMAAAAPGLIHIWMPPISAGGRWAHLPHDALLLDAVSGFAAHHPATEERPVASVVPTRLHLHGAMSAAAALAGLLARARDGWGRAATVTGLQAAGAALCTLMTASIDGPPIISTGKVVGGGCQFRLYQCGDEKWIFLGALSPELFFRALDVLGRMDVMVREDVAGDFTNILRPEIAKLVSAELEVVFKTRSSVDWLDAFRAADVPIAPLLDPSAWLEGEVVAGACPPVRAAHPSVGQLLTPGLFMDLSNTPGHAGPAPQPGSYADIRDVWQGVTPERPENERLDQHTLPLAGLRVVDASTFLAGPFVSSLLATHGAEVIKVESPAGDPYGVFTAPYAIVNEHKRTVKLNLRDAEQRARFLELVSQADVAVDNLLPASLERLQLGPHVYERANGNLVRCSVTAFGQVGAWADLPGFDPLLQTLSGLAAVQGGDGRPITANAPVHDVTTGAIGACGTLAALYVREITGESQRVFTSLAAVSTLLQSGELTTYEGRPARAWGGVDHPGPNPWQRYYRASDRWIAISARTSEQRSALVSVLNYAGPADADESELAAAIAALIAERSVEDWVVALAAAGVPACQVLERVEFDDPFLRDQRYTKVVHSTTVGRLRLIGGFADWRGAERREGTPPAEFELDPETVGETWGG